ncbi:hypothetical protein LCGC14_1128510 [marine sediment metagenome]|uniref:Uncharacterized protein n=1 Tax=marine sediment metagenome TaxID=412755 RepID=A0A0F9M6K0_9ZZZZ
MTTETLNEQDLDWLTIAENRMVRMRKRETANANSKIMIDDLTKLIEKTHTVRQWLQSRFEMVMDEDIHPLTWGDGK